MQRAQSKHSPSAEMDTFGRENTTGQTLETNKAKEETGPKLELVFQHSSPTSTGFHVLAYSESNRVDEALDEMILPKRKQQ